MLEVFACEAGAQAALALASLLDTDVDLLVTMVVDTALRAAGHAHPGAHRLVEECINGTYRPPSCRRCCPHPLHTPRPSHATHKRTQASAHQLHVPILHRAGSGACDEYAWTVVTPWLVRAQRVRP